MKKKNERMPSTVLWFWQWCSCLVFRFFSTGKRQTLLKGGRGKREREILISCCGAGGVEFRKRSCSTALTYKHAKVCEPTLSSIGNPLTWSRGNTLQKVRIDVVRETTSRQIAAVGSCLGVGEMASRPQQISLRRQTPPQTAWNTAAVCAAKPPVVCSPTSSTNVTKLPLMYMVPVGSNYFWGSAYHDGSVTTLTPPPRLDFLLPGWGRSVKAGGRRLGFRGTASGAQKTIFRVPNSLTIAGC